VRWTFCDSIAPLLERVRIFTGPDAGAAAERHNARAYALGNSVVFGPGEYSPYTVPGRRLLAHELGHVMQQSATGLPLASESQAEADADAFSRSVSEGNPEMIRYAAPRRPAYQKKTQKKADETGLPKSGNYFVVAYKDGSYRYTFNSEDVKNWSSPALKALGYHFQQAFVGATEDTAREFNAADAAYLEKDTKQLELPEVRALAAAAPTFKILWPAAVHARFVEWMRAHHPDMPPRRVRSGKKQLNPEDTRPGETGGGPPRGAEARAEAGPGAEGQPGGQGAGEGKTGGVPGAEGTAPAEVPVEEVRVQAPPPPRSKKPADEGQTGAGPAGREAKQAQPSRNDATRDQALESTAGSPWGEAGGAPEGIIQYEPLGDLHITPDLKAYVAHSTITARVQFELGHPFRAALNIFPHRADFQWTILKDGVEFDKNSITSGRIQYEITFGDPGTYTIAVHVTSSEFKNDQPLDLVSPPIKVLSEQDRDREIFGGLVGKERDKPFEVDASGNLRVKAGFKALTVDEEIDGLNAQIGAIEELKKEGKLDAATAAKYLAFFNEELNGLQKIKKVVGTRAYFVRGNMLNREDSTSAPVRVFMNQTNREKRPDGTAAVDVALYDSTMSPGEPERHTGHGEATPSGSDPDGFVNAELNAVKAMAGHWREYNQFPYGTLHFAVRMLEGPQTVYQWVIDTETTRKKVKKALTIGTAAAGVFLLAASAVTGGATAPVGVLLLEAAVAGATVALVLDSINERLETGTFHFDARFVMDMATLVTALIGGVGALRALAGSAGRASNGMLLFNLGMGAFSFMMMSQETRNEIDRVNAVYLAAIKNATTQEDKDRLDDERRKAIARIMGAAAANGALILVATGIAATHALGGGGLAAETATARRPGARGRGPVPGDEPPPPPLRPAPKVVKEGSRPLTRNVPKDVNIAAAGQPTPAGEVERGALGGVKVAPDVGAGQAAPAGKGRPALRSIKGEGAGDKVPRGDLRLASAESEPVEPEPVEATPQAADVEQDIESVEQQQIKKAASAPDFESAQPQMRRTQPDVTASGGGGRRSSTPGGIAGGGRGGGRTRSRSRGRPRKPDVEWAEREFGKRPSTPEQLMQGEGTELEQFEREFGDEPPLGGGEKVTGRGESRPLTARQAASEFGKQAEELVTSEWSDRQPDSTTVYTRKAGQIPADIDALYPKNIAGEGGPDAVAIDPIKREITVFDATSKETSKHTGQTHGFGDTLKANLPERFRAQSPGESDYKVFSQEGWYKGGIRFSKPKEH
jgi:hypothetical protein